MSEHTIVNVDLGDRAYPIHIGAGIDIAAVSQDLKGRRGLLISDSQVGPLHAERVQSAFAAAGADVLCVEVPAGESSKRIDIMPGLFSKAVEHGMERSSFIAAFGTDSTNKTTSSSERSEFQTPTIAHCRRQARPSASLMASSILASKESG